MPRECVVCGNSISGKRYRAKTCSVRCRKRLSRKKQWYAMLDAKSKKIEEVKEAARAYLRKIDGGKCDI